MDQTTPPLQRTLARNIRNLRERLGYSQLHLAERADMSTGHMNDVEQGRKWVSADSLQRIADALGVEPFMLLLPAGYSSETDAFSLLTEYAASVRERLDGALDSSLRDVMRRRSVDDDK